MATIKIVSRKKPISDGSLPVCLRVTKNRRTKYFSTIFRVQPYQWDDNQGLFKKNYPDYIKNNRVLNKLKSRAFNVYSDLEIIDPAFTLNQFEQAFRIENNPISNDVFSFWDEIIQEMKMAGRIGNARFYRDSKDSVKLFWKNKSLFFSDITPTFLNKYEVFLRSRGGTGGGIGVKMRSIRAVFNQAISRNLAKESSYPFNAYKISKLKGKSVKKALRFDEVLKIVNLEIDNYPLLLNSRNYFVFSFYTRGMNFADMMRLQWSDITDDRIFYTRSKTKGNFVIKILPPVQQVLEYYKKLDNGTPYVFPILLSNNLTPTQIDNRKHKTLKRYNKDLKEIASICGIEKSLSSYVARHSFANCLKQKGFPPM